MMKKLFYALSVSFIFLISCASMDYTKNGNEYTPLLTTDDVKLLLDSIPENRYEKIGIVRLTGGTEEAQITAAKVIARQKGGKAIIPLGAENTAGQDLTNELTSAVEDTKLKKKSSWLSFLPFLSSDVREFQIVRLIGAASLVSVESIQKEATNIKDLKESSQKLSSLKKASFKELIKDPASLKGNMYTASLFPKKILKIPPDLKKYSEKGDKLVLLTPEGSKKNYI